MGKNGAREEEPDARARRGVFIGRQGCLVTTPVTGSSPAREEAGHGVEVASMRREEMRTTISFYFSAEEVSWLGWAATRAVVLGCQGGLLLGFLAGLVRQVRSR